MKDLLTQILACRQCEGLVPLGPGPVVQAHPESKILVMGQAPGIKVHETKIPFNDKSGDNLRKWMQIEKEDFYDERKIAIMPMAFCYPGKGKSGDLPPRPECAPLWHAKIREALPNVKLTLLIGQYAQDYYLGKRRRNSLTETVREFENYLPEYFVLPHPSPRNNIWQAKNPWFRTEVLPRLEKFVQEILN